MIHQSFELLRTIASEEAGRRGESVMGVFGPVGLFLYRRLKYGGYRTTPKNSLAFAGTGGDGVHFSFLQVDGKSFGDSPVVMTVPAALSRTEGNIVVGENLLEFLGLGVQRGYFFLDQLVYKRKEAVAGYSLGGAPNQLAEEESGLLQVLRNQMKLVPWRDVASRLEDLRRKFGPWIQLPTEEEWTLLCLAEEEKDRKSSP